MLMMMLKCNIAKEYISVVLFIRGDIRRVISWHARLG